MQEGRSTLTFKEISIKIIPHDDQSYPTYGNYWVDENGVLQVRISEFDDPDVAFRTMIHELAEAHRCAKRGLDFREIDEFDLAHLDSDDPGLLKCAPYHTEHMQSDQLERLLCVQDGVKWEDHYNAVPKGDSHVQERCSEDDEGEEGNAEHQTAESAEGWRRETAEEVLMPTGGRPWPLISRF